MNRVCLDTSAYSHFLRGHALAGAAVSAAREVGIPTVVLGELRTGFRLGSQPARNEDLLGEFLRSPVVSVWPVDEPATHHYADIVAALRAAGTPVPTNDIWIAAVAATRGAVVLTLDEHFRRIQRVGSVVLPVAE